MNKKKELGDEQQQQRQLDLEEEQALHCFKGSEQKGLLKVKHMQLPCGLNFKQFTKKKQISKMTKTKKNHGHHWSILDSLDWASPYGPTGGPLSTDHSAQSFDLVKIGALDAFFGCFRARSTCMAHCTNKYSLLLRWTTGPPWVSWDLHCFDCACLIVRLARNGAETAKPKLGFSNFMFRSGRFIYVPGEIKNIYGLDMREANRFGFISAKISKRWT